MNYNTDNQNTNDLVEDLVQMNGLSVMELQQSKMPMMVAVQEKDWDTMVDLLQRTIEFQPIVFD